MPDIYHKMGSRGSDYEKTAINEVKNPLVFYLFFNSASQNIGSEFWAKCVEKHHLDVN